MRSFVLCLLALSAQAQGGVFEDLHSLYPYFTRDEIRLKRQESTTPFKFYRAFVPYFYRLIAADPLSGLADAPIAAQAGWCTGDPHLENFGVVLDDAGSPMFTMNDLDDAGPCPLYADVLRFLASAWVHDASIDLEPLLASYQSALEGGSRPFSEVVQARLRSVVGGNVMDESLLKKPNRLKRSGGAKDLLDSEKRDVTAVLRALYGNEVRFVDGVRSKWYKGGSGGMQHFRVLVDGLRHPGLASREIFDFKQIQRAAIFPVATQVVPGDKERFGRTLVLERGTNSKFHSLQTVGSLTMLVHPRWKGVMDTDLGDLSNDQVREIAVDEAMVLGQLHLKAAFDSVGYRRAFSSISHDSWRRAALILSRKNADAFEATAATVPSAP